MGLFGVIGYQVSRRTRDIGIRMALGAEPQHVVRDFLGQSLILVVWGMVGVSQQISDDLERYVNLWRDLFITKGDDWVDACSPARRQVP